MAFKIENKKNILNFEKSRLSIYAKKLSQTDFSDKTTNFTVDDKDTYLYCNSTSIITVTLPVPSLNLNRNLIFVNRTDNQVNSSINITKISSGALITSNVLLEGQKGYWCQLVSDGTKWINIISKKYINPSFIFTVNTSNITGNSTGNKQFRLPLISDGTYNFKVDWGDGSNNLITSYNQAEITHTYSSSGTYTIKILGDCIGWKFNDSGDQNKIIDISNWGVKFGFGTGTQSSGAFYGCTRLNISAKDSPNLIGTTNFNSFFRNCFALNCDLSSWNVSNITNMGNMFYSATSFNQNISSWDVSNVTTMLNMFLNATSFNQNISSWNVSNVTTMGNMFNNATSFNNGGYPLLWSAPKCNYFGFMFSNNSFNQPLPNLYKNPTATSCIMGYMFYYNTSFNQDISGWDVSNVTNMGNMFENAISFKQNLSTWVPYSATYLSNIFLNIDINKSDSDRSNYDSLLISWGTTNVSLLTNNVNFSILSKYSNITDVLRARFNLLINKRWTITDGGI